MAHAGFGDSLEGVHAVAAALDAGRLIELTVEERRLASTEVGRLVEAARRQGVSVVVVDDISSLAATTAPQGVVASAHPVTPVTVDELVSVVDPPAVVVLDHLEDGRNVGAIARSAVGAGVPALLVAGRRAAPLGPAAFKTAAGALDSASVAVVSSVAAALERLRRAGLWLVGLDGDAPLTIWECDLWDEPIAVVIGAEGTGLSHLVSQTVDVTVRIPIDGIESLNASAAASVALFELSRRRQS